MLLYFQILAFNFRALRWLYLDLI